jgi:aromatic ring-opening dioxygenase catalytic subunit (LigB family)
LAPLRDDGILMVGSGMSYHNMRGFGMAASTPASDVFDAALSEAVCRPQAQSRNERLEDWQSLPYARDCHPREEHLLPLMVVAGAAGDDQGERIFSDHVMNTAVSAFRFG